MISQVPQHTSDGSQTHIHKGSIVLIICFPYSTKENANEFYVT